MSDADVKMPPLPEPAYWYVVDKHGAATLCADERDARKVAAECATDWPNLAPYRVVHLVTADQLRAAVLAERERFRAMFDEALADHGITWPGEVDILYEKMFLAAIRKGTP